MKTAILSVGTELLFGQISNTNTVYLSQQLNMLGFDVMYHHTVGDNPGRLKETINLIFKDCDLIITTGGLGPTQDDLTKEIVTETMGDELVLHEDVYDKMKKYFDKNGVELTENNKKQAYLPKHSLMLPNDTGTAPGFVLENNGKYIACLPGPPREMTHMFATKLKPYLEEKSKDVIVYKMIRTIGIGESMLETKLLDLIDGQTDPTLATYAKEGEACLRIASKRNTREDAEKAVDNMLNKVKERIGEYIYSCDDKELWQVVCKKIVDEGISVSAAESCTGGMFAEALTSFPGMSGSLGRSFVTYSNEAKEEILGVSHETLSKHGAVSEETAVEMARGVKKISGCDLAVSVTGIAGPGGGSEDKPVGLVYVGIILGNKEICRELRLRNVSREWIRQMTVLHTFGFIYHMLRNED